MNSKEYIGYRVRTIASLTRLSRYQQEQIIDLTDKNVPIRKIAELLECDRGQVFRLQKKHSITKPSPPLAAEALQALDSGIFRRLKGLPNFWIVKYRHILTTSNGMDSIDRPQISYS